MIGPLLALVFELYLATPELFAFDLWTGQQISFRTAQSEPVDSSYFANNRFWPIPTEDLDPVAHTDCTCYPHCLYQLSVQSRQRALSPTDTLAGIRNRWLMHRCGALRKGSGDTDQIPCWSPMPLKYVCRAAIRRLIVKIHGMW
ncbi:unnamed protein product [Echinostoma caproni]|uniref:Secreted protein n=1 Tax=Echinostoma caproni TaxID=27848 RepID=A0A183A0L7_9TREM|nr:unnamed protein product [Echinostoma caproni]